MISNDYEYRTDSKRILLSSWHSGREEDPIIVIDHTSVAVGTVVDNTILRNKQILAQNADVEARINLKYGITEGQYICTMVNEQVILSGTEEGFDLVSICKRRGIAVPSWMDKDIINEFLVWEDDELFEAKHILYNAADAIVLPKILTAQQKAIDVLKLNYLIRIRSRLVKILARGENYGFVHDSKRWEEIAVEKEKQAKEICGILTEVAIGKYGVKPEKVNSSYGKKLEVQKRQKQRKSQRKEKLEILVKGLESRGKIETKAYKTSQEQLLKLGASSVVGLSSKEGVQCLVVPTEEVINWGSSQQVLAILQEIKCPIPLGVDKKTYGKKIPSVSKEARNEWFVEHGDGEFKDLFELFDKYKRIAHNIRSFGIPWIQTYVKDGIAYTIFRQTGTRTLRFASGKEDEGYFNLQQIPKETVKMIIDGVEEDVAIYRECFGTKPGRSMTTLDLIGAEVVLMVSLSGDLQLKKITDLPDQHSYMGTKCWRDVYTDRYGRTGEVRWKELSETYTMQKGKERDKFKNSGIFPVLYGVKESKVASVQGFSTRDARVFIDRIEAEMPVVVTYVKEKAKFALTNGYVLHNTRTNSRRWFPDVLRAKKTGEALTSRQKSAVENAARNSPVQGSQIDAICEGMVLIDRWSKIYKVDIEFMGQVHDELIYDHPDELNEWIEERLATAMKKAAKCYLMKEISMDVESRQGKTWLKDKRKNGYKR